MATDVVKLFLWCVSIMLITGYAVAAIAAFVLIFQFFFAVRV